MCGIAGGFSFSNSTFSASIIDSMLSSIFHRGPDDQGVYLDSHSKVFLSMRRLSIIDINSGKQPFYNESRTLVSTVNGEIYNYKKLRSELISKGHVFASHSDCEVVIHAFEEWGEGFISKINGMFAIAIYSVTENSLYLYRDRFGIKPLYYYFKNNQLYYSSEIKSFVFIPEFDKTISRDALNYYLSFGYVPEPYCLFKNVNKVKPGECVSIKASGIVKEKYFTYTFSRNPSSCDISEFDNSLSNAVSSHLQSDVPVGILLSGGIDSSALTAIASKFSSSKISTFSSYFEDEYSDESYYIDKVNKAYDCNSHKVKITSDEYLEIAKKMIWNLDEPISDLAFPALYKLCKLARDQGFIVLLSGEGSDELLAGYSRRIDSSKSNDQLLYRFKQNLKYFYKNNLKLNDLYACSNLNTFQWFMLTKAHGYSLPEINQLFDRGRNNNNVFKLLSEDFILNPSSDNLIETVMLADIWYNLPGTLLAKADKMSMAASVEIRVPFLDDEFAKMASSISIQQKIDSSGGKLILKKAMERYLPNEVIYRKKRGWPVPIESWIKKDFKNTVKSQIMDDYFIDQFSFNRKYLQNLFLDIENGKSRVGMKIWILYLLSIWSSYFLKNSSFCIR